MQKYELLDAKNIEFEPKIIEIGQIQVKIWAFIYFHDARFGQKNEMGHSLINSQNSKFTPKFSMLTFLIFNFLIFKENKE